MYIRHEVAVEYIKFRVRANNLDSRLKKKYRKFLTTAEIYNRKEQGRWPYIPKNAELHFKINKKYSVGFRVVNSFRK